MCQTAKINANTALEDATGDLSFKVTFNISRDDASNGWGMFLQPEAEYYDFERRLNEHRSAADQSSEYSRSWSSNTKGQRKGSSKGRTPKLQLPNGVTLGLRPGDLVSFSISWPSLPDAKPLKVWGVVH